MSDDDKLSIANLSWLSGKNNFLLQTSKKSKKLGDFISNDISADEKTWLIDLKSWELNDKWLLKISDICLKEYEQVFFDFGEELFDLNDSENYQKFREKILEELM